MLLTLGACAGGWIGFADALEVLVLVFCESLAAAALTVLPGKALAATSANTPVSATEPATSQRFARLSLRKAASLAFVDLGDMASDDGKPRNVTKPHSWG